MEVHATLSPDGCSLQDKNTCMHLADTGVPWIHDASGGSSDRVILCDEKRNEPCENHAKSARTCESRSEQEQSISQSIRDSEDRE